LERLLLYWDPDLLIHLRGVEMIGELWAIPWLITLFADVLPMEEVIRLWDILILADKSFLACFAVAVVFQMRKAIMKQDNQAGVMLVFSQLNAEVTKIDVGRGLIKAFLMYTSTPKCLLCAQEEGKRAAG